jgi:Spy/CpxP family protein refolding chaperone
MSKFAFLKTVIAAGGFLLLCAAPELALGQLSQPGAAPPAPMEPASAPRARPAAPPDLLDGLTLADDQKAKIGQIREETKSHLAAVANDRTLSPEAADAMRRGYARLENGKILEVLTPEQQRQVRKRIAGWRDSKGKPQYPLRRAPVSEQTARPQ